jgi:hypothetical protein
LIKKYSEIGHLGERLGAKPVEWIEASSFKLLRKMNSEKFTLGYGIR